LKVKLDAL